MTEHTFTRRQRLRFWLYEQYIRFPNKASQKVAYALPRRVAYWAAIRVIANATTGPLWSAQVVPDLTAMDALQRWGCCLCEVGKVEWVYHDTEGEERLFCDRHARQQPHFGCSGWPGEIGVGHPVHWERVHATVHA